MSANGEKTRYRVSHLLADLGWVDSDLGCSTTLLGQKIATIAATSGRGEPPKSKSTQPRFARRWTALY